MKALREGSRKYMQLLVTTVLHKHSPEVSFCVSVGDNRAGPCFPALEEHIKIVSG